MGLPTGQEYRLSDSIPYAALDGITQEQAIQQAMATRPDYLSAKARLKAAELARQAASAENYPSLSTGLNYGDIGSPNFGIFAWDPRLLFHSEHPYLSGQPGAGG